MARTAITPTQTSRTATDITTAGASDSVNGLTVSNNGRVHVFVRTTTADAAVTFALNGDKGSAAASETGTPVVRTYSLGANTETLIGPFDVALYGPQLLINHAQATTKILVVAVA